MKTMSPNIQGHWTRRHILNRRNAKIIWAKWMQEKPKIELPCTITLTRIASREMDSDNVQGSFKAIRDCLASLIIPGLAPGQADSDSRLEWRYRQEKGTRKQQVRIRIE